MRQKYDAIVVGSGAGGGTIAYELSKKKRVLIIEAGPLVKQDFLGNFYRISITPGYYGGLVGLKLSREGTIIYHTKNVGGTTIVSCGNMARSLEGELASLGINLEDEFLEAEKDIKVKPLAKKRIVTGTKVINDTANKLGLNMVQMPKGMKKAVDCDLCGDCVLGCHREAKWDARIYVDLAIKNGAKLLYSTKIEKVLFSNNHQVRGVQTKEGRILECGTIILSAGGLNTPIILQKSGIPAGNRLFVDLFNVTVGITDNLSQLIGPSMGTVITDYHDEGFILSPFIDHWSQQALCYPLIWNMRNRFSNKRLIGIMTKITDDHLGKVKSNGIISKPLTKRDHSRLDAGAGIAKKILLEAGARDIVTSRRPRGAHPGGTAAIGEVVDNELKVKGCEGLFVCDASVFPETPGLPPILTIVALAKWLSKKV